MAFEVLDETKPAGGDERRFGDDVIRQHIRAIRQRLSSVFVDIDVDPMVAKPGIIPGTAIADLGVATGKLADAGVTQAKLAKPSVGNPELINLAVDTGKLADGSVTQPKLGALAVGTGQLAAAAVTAAKLAANAVVPGSIDPAGAFTFNALNTILGLRINGAAPVNQLLVGDGSWGNWRALVSADIPDAVLQKLLIRCEGWYLNDTPGTATSFMTRWQPLGGLDQHVAVMTRAGELRSLFIRGNADRTAGSFIAKLILNGVTTAVTATIDGANPRQVIATFAAGAVPFAAGDQLGLAWESIGLVPANTTEYIAGFEVRYT